MPIMETSNVVPPPNGVGIVVTERIDETEAIKRTEVTEATSLIVDAVTDAVTDRDEISPAALASDSESENEAVIQSESEWTLCVGALGAVGPVSMDPLDNGF